MKIFILNNELQFMTMIRLVYYIITHTHTYIPQAHTHIYIHRHTTEPISTHTHHIPSTHTLPQLTHKIYLPNI